MGSYNIFGRFLGRAIGHGLPSRMAPKPASPRPGTGGPEAPKPPSAPSQHGGGEASPHEDLERAARGFVEDNAPLADDPGASTDVLQRVYVQGANVFTTITPELVAAAKRAEEAKYARAAAIRDRATPAPKLRRLEEEDAEASRFYESLGAASRELGDFLDRVQERLPEDEG